MEIIHMNDIIGKSIFLLITYTTLAATIRNIFKPNSICCLPKIVNKPVNDVATILTRYIKHKHLMYSPATSYPFPKTIRENCGAIK